MDSTDLEPSYDAEIAPLMAQIIAVAQKHDIPFVATFQLRDDAEQGWLHCSSAHMPEHADETIRRMRRVITERFGV